MIPSLPTPIHVIIPTRNRYSSLDLTLTSIPPLTNLFVTCIFDADPPSLARFFSSRHSRRPNFRGVIHPVHSGSVALRNLITPTIPPSHSALFATDDIIFAPDSIVTAASHLTTLFPDLDGVIGFNQSEAHHPTGVSLIGASFLLHYPNRQPFHPGYFHFAAQEVYDLAISLERFHYADDCFLTHRAPYARGKNKLPYDQTHCEARAKAAQDKALYKERHSLGLVWGGGEEGHSPDRVHSLVGG